MWTREHLEEDPKDELACRRGWWWLWPPTSMLNWDCFRSFLQNLNNLAESWEVILWGHWVHHLPTLPAFWLKTTFPSTNAYEFDFVSGKQQDSIHSVSGLGHICLLPESLPQPSPLCQRVSPCFPKLWEASVSTKVLICCSFRLTANSMPKLARSSSWFTQGAFGI